MKNRRDPERLDALTTSESDAALARALKALAQDRPSADELERMRRRLQGALRQQTAARANAVTMQPAAGLIVLGAALLSLLPSPGRLAQWVAPRAEPVAAD